MDSARSFYNFDFCENMRYSTGGKISLGKESEFVKSNPSSSLTWIMVELKETQRSVTELNFFF